MSIIDDARDWQQAIVDRTAAQQQVADLENQILTANLQHGNDQGKIDDLKKMIANDDAMLAADSETISKFAAQLQQAQMQLAAFPNLQFIDGYESDVVQPPLPLPTTAVPLPEAKHIGWYPVISPKVGGQRPSAHLAHFMFGKLILEVSGVPGKYCDVLWANKRPALPPNVTTFALDFATTPVSSGDPLSVQCLEWDTLDVYQHMKGNLSSQRKQSTGELQIANGLTGGGWLNSGIVIDKFDLGVRHKIRWIYGRDVVGKSVQYIAFILDGKRYDIDPKVGKQPMYAEPIWGDQLTIQLQQDVNDHGGTLVSAFDSIRYMYVAG